MAIYRMQQHTVEGCCFIGETSGIVDRSTVCEIFNETCEVIVHLLYQYITFPSVERQQQFLVHERKIMIPCLSGYWQYRYFRAFSIYSNIDQPSSQEKQEKSVLKVISLK